MESCTSHHWLIEPAENREPSLGTCKLCGETKVFINSLMYDHPWGKKGPANLTAEQRSEIAQRAAQTRWDNLREADERADTGITGPGADSSSDYLDL